MIALACGGRTWGSLNFVTVGMTAQAVAELRLERQLQREMVFLGLDKLHGRHRFKQLIHGGAAGADTCARDWAVDRGVWASVYPANWLLHGRSAGPRRNQYMLDHGKPGLVVAWPGGAGTADMVARAVAAAVAIVLVAGPDGSLPLL